MLIFVESFTCVLSVALQDIQLMDIFVVYEPGKISKKLYIQCLDLLYSEMNWDFEALEFLTFSGNKILGDHARWDPHKGENVKCSLLKMLEQSIYVHV